MRSDGSLCCFLQDAVDENELRKKQEEAMREKLLAQEAKQHDPKVPKNKHNVNPTSAIPDEVRGETSFFLLIYVQVQAQKKRHQQQDLIAELRRRQAKDHRPVYEGKDGTIEDIITGGPGSQRSRITVVVHSSPHQQCTLCYVIKRPLHHSQRNFQMHIS